MTPNLWKLRTVILAAMLLSLAVVSVTPALAGQLPATGQTTAFQADKNDGIGGPVDVPDDGTLQRGATLNYKVLQNGTIIDLNTGFIWEVKVAGTGCLHCVDDTYVWSGTGSQDTIWDWLDDINAEGGTGYAGHNDWRIPNVRELQSIVDYGLFNPAIDPIFGPTATGAAAGDYWSSTSFATNSSLAYGVTFFDGGVSGGGKTNSLGVRAVRGGPK